MKIEQISDNQTKSLVTRIILGALPDWFGIEESRESYIAGSKDKQFFYAYDDEKTVGFLYLKQTGKDTVELAVMGVLKEYHRHGIGKALFEAACKAAVDEGFSFMQVKTVKMGVYENYDKTNLFYQSLGFKELEVFPSL